MGDNAEPGSAIHSEYWLANQNWVDGKADGLILLDWVVEGVCCQAVFF